MCHVEWLEEQLHTANARIAELEGEVQGLNVKHHELQVQLKTLEEYIDHCGDVVEECEALKSETKEKRTKEKMMHEKESDDNANHQAREEYIERLHSELVASDRTARHLQHQLWGPGRSPSQEDHRPCHCRASLDHADPSPRQAPPSPHSSTLHPITPERPTNMIPDVLALESPSRENGSTTFRQHMGNGSLGCPSPTPSISARRYSDSSDVREHVIITQVNVNSTENVNQVPEKGHGHRCGRTTNRRFTINILNICLFIIAMLVSEVSDGMRGSIDYNIGKLHPPASTGHQGLIVIPHSSTHTTMTTNQPGCFSAVTWKIPPFKGITTADQASTYSWAVFQASCKVPDRYNDNGLEIAAMAAKIADHYPGPSDGGDGEVACCLLGRKVSMLWLSWAATIP